jgi:hypothetical protein
MNKKQVAKKMRDIHPPKKSLNTSMGMVGEAAAKLRRHLSVLDSSKKHIKVTHKGKELLPF